MAAPALAYRYDGTVMIPLQPRLCARDFKAGGVYRLAEEQERSARTHNHFFAALASAYDNLPEDLMEEYPSVEHLRKKLLIRAGFCEGRDFVCGTKAEALRLAAFLRPMDEYAIVVVKDCVVRVLTAKSQSKRAMGAAEFKASKTAVLGHAARLIGVRPEDLKRSQAA